MSTKKFFSLADLVTETSYGQSTAKLDQFPFEVTISERAQRQIDFLCATFPNTEWSGAVFYKLANEDFDLLELLEEGKTIPLEVIGLYPLDLGDGSATQYKADDPTLFQYLTNHPEYISTESSTENVYQGHIHSHHSLSAFFSGVDQRELFDSAEESNLFFSLIVNNSGPYAVGFSTKINREANMEILETYTSWNHKKKQRKFTKRVEPESITIWAESKIGDKAHLTTSGEEDFDKKVAELKNKKTVTFQSSTIYSGSQPKSYGYSNGTSSSSFIIDPEVSKIYPMINYNSVRNFLIAAIRRDKKPTDSSLSATLFLVKDLQMDEFREDVLEFLNQNESVFWPSLYTNDTAMCEVYKACVRMLESPTVSTFTSTKHVAHTLLKLFKDTVALFKPVETKSSLYYY